MRINARGCADPQEALVYIRLSLMKAKPGREAEVAAITDRLVAFYRGQPGFVSGYALRAADETGDAGRVTVWASMEAADRVAQSNHNLSLRSDLIPLIEDGSDVERSFWADGVQG
jgi:hypothetical protein